MKTHGVHHLGWLEVLGAGLILLLGLVFSASAQEKTPLAAVPDLVHVGFSDFKAFGYPKAFITWSFGGPLAQDTRWQKRLGDAAPFWNSLGRCLSYDQVQVQSISSRSSEVTLAAQFERGEVFFRFIVYNVMGRQTITSIEWATDPAQLNYLPQ